MIGCFRKYGYAAETIHMRLRGIIDEVISSAFMLFFNLVLISILMSIILVNKRIFLNRQLLVLWFVCVAAPVG